MTAVCGGGASSPKPLTEAVVAYSYGRIAQLLVEFGLSEFSPLIPLVGLLPVVASAFCAIDPPPVTAMTTAEADALLQLKLGADFDSGLGKLTSIVLNALWYDICQCNAPPQPVHTPTTFPSGAIVLTPPKPETANPCRVIDARTDIVLHGTENLTFIFSGQLPPGAGMAHITGNVVAVGGPGTSFTFTWYQVDYSSAVIATDTFGPVAPGSSAAIDVTLLPTCKELSMRATGDGSANTSNPEGSRFDIYCGADTPTSTRSPCCPPDDATFGALSSILDIVRSMQRFYHPFAYNFGMTFGPFTGTGHVDLDRSIGVQVAIAHQGAGFVSPGNPNYIYDQGWCSVEENGRMIAERRISQTGFTWFAPFMPVATRFNFYLRPTVQILVTPVLAEP